MIKTSFLIRLGVANGLEKHKQVLMTTGEGPMAVDLKYSGLILANDHAFYVSG